jgi:putative membrane protein
MASWDFMLDPTASTINHYWIWENGGGFFGVPFVNYLGWLMTVFIFFSIFARSNFSIARTNRRTADVVAGVYSGASFWVQAILMYALLGVRYVLTYLTPTKDSQVMDAVGHVWYNHDIYQAGALAAIFSVFSLSILAALRLIDPRADIEGSQRLTR